MGRRKTSFSVGLGLLCLLFVFGSRPSLAATAGEATQAQLPQIGDRDQLAVFQLQRGSYVATQLGMFATVTGTHRPSLPQPFLALSVGRDLGDTLSLQLTTSWGYSVGNPASANNDPTQLPADLARQANVSYEMLNAGVEIVAALRPTQRFAIEPKLGLGVTRLDPALRSASDRNVVLGVWQNHLLGGIELKYLTLLTHFSAGVAFNGIYVTGVKVVGVGTAASVRYTF